MIYMAVDIARTYRDKRRAATPILWVGTGRPGKHMFPHGDITRQSEQRQICLLYTSRCV